MKKPLRSLSALLLVSALAGLAALLVFDAFNHLRLTPFHQRTGALSFMLIGASYISLQLATRRQWNEKLKGILLGTGFFLWGCEQFVPPGPLATVMDSLVVLIFVSDLGLVIMDRLKRKDDEAG
jgi:peptidoglycan/LPS O-acetylase OafA/YrhL